MIEWGNVIVVLLVLAALAIVAERVYSYRKNRPIPLTAEELEQLDLQAQQEEAAREDEFWDQHRAELRKLINDILQHSARSDLRIVEDREAHTLNLVGRLLHTEEYPFVTIGTRAESFYYLSREASLGGEAGGSDKSPEMATIEELRRWLVEQWTYG
ncbi:MAG: hypothetical protein U0528_02440 [Anaerolineae bacterium]|nr:hypothetical protein [Anaerolineae bacterium]